MHMPRLVSVNVVRLQQSKSGFLAPRAHIITVISNYRLKISQMESEHWRIMKFFLLMLVSVLKESAKCKNSNFYIL